jgi:hypothetical protein
MPEKIEKVEDNKRMAQLVRVYESACHLSFTTDEDVNFRIALSKALGLEFGLREVRPLTIDGPGKPPPKAEETPRNRK